MLVRDFMTATPHTIGRDQTLAAARDKMRALGVRHLPVLDAGRLAGVVSQRDIYFIETLADPGPGNVSVEEAMSIDVYTVTPDTTVLEVAAEMANRKYGCAVVVEGSHVAGIFTTVDALRALIAATAS
jgi:acetoin utilization protein AcuB